MQRAKGNKKVVVTSRSRVALFYGDWAAVEGRRATKDEFCRISYSAYLNQSNRIRKE